MAEEKKHVTYVIPSGMHLFIQDFRKAVAQYISSYNVIPSKIEGKGTSIPVIWRGRQYFDGTPIEVVVDDNLPAGCLVVFE